MALPAKALVSCSMVDRSARFVGHDIGREIGHHIGHHIGRVGNRGRLPEWLKGADCKSADIVYIGSNPIPPIDRIGVDCPPRFWEIPGSRGCSSMVEQQPSKLNTRVRFPSPALSQSVPEWRPQAACEARANYPPSTNRCWAGDWYGDSQDTWGQGPETGDLRQTTWAKGPGICLGGDFVERRCTDRSVRCCSSVGRARPW